MASELPYLPSYKNVEKLFQKIQAAKQPDAFTHNFLYETLGLKAVGDRPLIAFLRTLGFLDGSSKPTASYAALKNQALAPKAIADAIRHAYAPLFSADENAHKLPQDQLKGLIAQVAGSDAGTTSKIAGTLNATMKLADFSSAPAVKPPDRDSASTTLDTEPKEGSPAALRPEFHYNIQVGMPPVPLTPP